MFVFGGCGGVLDVWARGAHAVVGTFQLLVTPRIRREDSRDCLTWLYSV